MSGDGAMTTLVASGMLAATITFAPSAEAGERAGDAALGAVAGAVAAGPVGLVAGGMIGYTAGPGIATEWGVRRSRHHRHRTVRRHRDHQYLRCAGGQAGDDYNPYYIRNTDGPHR
jgi:hypothetical protein